jgi:hypothetical protein
MKMGAIAGVLVIAACLAAAAGFTALTDTTRGVGMITIGGVLAIVARIAQASAYRAYDLAQRSRAHETQPCPACHASNAPPIQSALVEADYTQQLAGGPLIDNSGAPSPVFVNDEHVRLT